MDRIKYVDTLKFLAIFSIIILHIMVMYGDVGFLKVLFRDYKEIFRFGVPLFLMITGMLTLNKSIDLEIFFKKKLVRIVYPLLFFFIIAYLLGIYNNFFNTYWYCWMTIGIYLAIPIINIYIKNATQKDLDYIIILILVSSLIYSIVKAFNMKIALDLDFFIGPASYLILGYYFSRKEFNLSTGSVTLISLIMFISVSLYKVCSSDYVYVNNTNWILSLLNLSFPQILQTVSVFIFVKYLYESSQGIFAKFRDILECRYLNDFIVSVSRSSYGIYLFHMILLRGLISPYFENLSMSGTNTLIMIIFLSVGMFLVSWIGIVILSRVPIISKFSGYA